MRTLRLTIINQVDNRITQRTAVVPTSIVGVTGSILGNYTIIRTIEGGELHVSETPDVVFHELDAALAETIMTESTDAESYSGLGRRMTEGFDHVVEAIDSYVAYLAERDAEEATVRRVEERKEYLLAQLRGEVPADDPKALAMLRNALSKLPTERDATS